MKYFHQLLILCGGNMKPTMSIDTEIAKLEMDKEELNIEIEKKQIAIDSFKKARSFIRSDQVDKLDEDIDSDENEDSDPDKDQDENGGLFDDDPEETAPEEETKLMKGSFAWKAKEALRKSGKPMRLAEISKACDFNEKQKGTFGVIISQYARNGKIFMSLGKGIYGLKALKNKY